MEWTTALLAGMGFFLAGTIKGTTGLGYTTCALPFLVAAMGLKAAMAVVIIPAMATNLGVAFSTGYMVETLRRFKTMYIAMVPGVVVGTHLLMWMRQEMAIKVLGFTIIGYALLALVKPHVALPSNLVAPLQCPTGFLNGIMAGLTGAQVMPLFPYMMALNLPTDRLVQAINLAVLITSFTSAAALSSTGIITLPLSTISVVAIIPALIGVQLGTRARRYIPEARFKRLVLLTLLLMGFMMLIR
jgi:uncharacterized protein